MSEPNGNGNSQRYRAQWFQWGAVIISTVALVGSVGGIYSNIQSELRDNHRSVEELRARADSLERRLDDLRAAAIKADEDIRGSIRLLTTKIIDMGNP